MKAEVGKDRTGFVSVDHVHVGTASGGQGGVGQEGWGSTGGEGRGRLGTECHPSREFRFYSPLKY